MALDQLTCACSTADREPTVSLGMHASFAANTDVWAISSVVRKNPTLVTTEETWLGAHHKLVRESVPTALPGQNADLLLQTAATCAYQIVNQYFPSNEVCLFACLLVCCCILFFVGSELR